MTAEGKCPHCKYEEDKDGPFFIKCHVEGGVTGSRTAILKADGELVRLGTRDEADTKAASLNRLMNHEHSRAKFTYTVTTSDAV